MVEHHQVGVGGFSTYHGSGFFVARSCGADLGMVSEMKTNLISRQNALFGLTIALIVHAVLYYVVFLRKEWLPADRWFQVLALEVKDAEPGQDPAIVFQRDILLDTPGTFISIVTRHSGKDDRLGTYYCFGQGGSVYVADRKLPPSAVNLSWIMNREGNPCEFSPGVYRLTIVWTMTPEGYPAKVITKESNYFTVQKKEETP